MSNANNKNIFVFIVNFEQFPYNVLVFSLLTLNKYIPAR